MYRTFFFKNQHYIKENENNIDIIYEYLVWLVTAIGSGNSRSVPLTIHLSLRYFKMSYGECPTFRFIIGLDPQHHLTCSSERPPTGADC